MGVGFVVGFWGEFGGNGRKMAAEKWGGIAFPIAGTADPFSVEDTGLGRGLTTEYSEYAEDGGAMTPG